MYIRYDDPFQFYLKTSYTKYAAEINVKTERILNLWMDILNYRITSSSFEINKNEKSATLRAFLKHEASHLVCVVVALFFILARP